MKEALRASFIGYGLLFFTAMQGTPISEWRSFAPPLTYWGLSLSKTYIAIACCSVLVIPKHKLAMPFCALKPLQGLFFNSPKCSQTSVNWYHNIFVNLTSVRRKQKMVRIALRFLAFCTFIELRLIY